MYSQKDIAEKAGVSRATVSRAFTNNANIKESTLAKIRDAMNDLGMEPILGEEPKKENSSNKYVLIIAGDVADNFYANIIKGVCDRLLKDNIYTVVCNSNYVSAFEEQYLKTAQHSGFCGIVLVTAVETSELVSILRNMMIPVVLVNRYIRSLNTDMIIIDNYNGGYMATRHLIENGHSKIAHLTGHRDSTSTQDRMRGYQDALAESNLIACNKAIYYGDQGLSSGRSFADKLFEAGMPYTAAFIGNCPMAIGAANRFFELGISIPDDFSIICFDDSPLIGKDGLNLSTVCYNPYSMGILSADTLIRHIEMPFSDHARTILSPQLYQRASVKNINKI